MAFPEFNMNTKSFVIRRSLLVMSAGVLLFASGDRCMSQDADQKENQLRTMRLLFGAEGLDVISPTLNGQESGPRETQMLPPGTKSLSELHSSGRRSAQRSNPETKYFREQISQQIDFLARQGNDVQQLRELVEQLQLAQENSAQRTTREVEVAVFAVPEAAQEGPGGPQNEGHPRVGLSFAGQPPAGAPNFGPPNFGPPMMRMEGRAEMRPGQGPQIHQPEVHSPEGQFAEDRRRIAALNESAERITQAGLPDVAHGLRERAGQLERELAEKQKRMQQEERKRMESAMRERQAQTRQQPQRLMEQRREGVERGDQPTPPLRELHEQLEQVRRDMHKLSEQMAVLTRLIQQHHNPGHDRGHHGDMDDDEDGDDEDGDDEDGDDEDGDDEDGDDEDGDDEDGDDEDGDDEEMDDDEDGDDKDEDEEMDDDHEERGEPKKD